MSIKPTCACDVDLAKQTYPALAMPKIDGVRGLADEDKLVARSGKPFKNKMNTEFFSKPAFNGFDSELTFGAITREGLCGETTGAMGRIKGTDIVDMNVFDYIIEETKDMPYLERLKLATVRVETLLERDPTLRGRISVVPHVIINSQEELEAIELQWLEEGYEGVILRGIDSRYKQGRCTANEGYYLRLKRFMDTEILITEVVEGTTNNNPAKKTPHGRTERATVAANMVGNGRIGTIIGVSLEDKFFNGKLVVAKGSVVDVSPGKMNHKDREYLFTHQDEILGKIGKYQFFPIGIKDKPRFPTFQCFRDKVDMGDG